MKRSRDESPTRHRRRELLSRGALLGGALVFERDLPAVLALHTDRLSVRNLTIEWADDVPSYFTHAIEAESFRELVVDGFRGRQAQKAGSAIRLAGGEDVVVRNSRAGAGTRHVRGGDGGDGTNRLQRQRRPGRSPAGGAGFVRPPEAGTRSRPGGRTKVDSALPARGRPSCRPCVDPWWPPPSPP